MSAGFGVGLTHLCWPEPLDTRLQVLQTVVKETGMPLLRELLHPGDGLEPKDLHNLDAYRVVEVTHQEWRWLEESESRVIREAVRNRWTAGASYEDCFLLCDEETTLVLPDVDRARLGSNGKALLAWPVPGDEPQLVYAETSRVLEQLRSRMDDEELQLSQQTLGTLRLGAEMMEICLKHRLAFHVGWS